MKLNAALSFSLMLTLFVGGVSHASPKQCKELIAGPKLFDKMTQWRADMTHADQSGEIAPTSATREFEIKASHRENQKNVFNAETGFMNFFPAEGTKIIDHTETKGYQTGTYTRFTVSGLGPSGILKGTLTLPVSAHDGEAKARQWAKEDTYAIVYQGPPSPLVKTDLTYRRRNLVQEAQIKAGQLAPQAPVKMGYSLPGLVHGADSLGVTTIQEIQIPLVKNQIVKVLYYRQGSAGPGGFPESRIIEFLWDGN